MDRNFVLFTDEIGHALVIDEVYFVGRRSLPFRRLPRREQGCLIVKPKFSHAVKVRRPCIAWDMHSPALNESAQAGNACPYRPVHISPVASKCFGREISSASNAVDELEHGALFSEGDGTRTRNHRIDSPVL
jgi:hypothetical protein